MNAPIPISQVPQAPSMARSFRQYLTDPRLKPAVMEALGWDDSQVSRFLSGTQGITIDKLDAAIGALNMVPVTRRYLNAIRELGKTGAACVCASEGRGECGWDR